MPLALSVPEDADVQVAVASAGAVYGHDVPLVGDAWTEHAGEWTTRVTAVGAEASQRLVARVRPDPGTTGLGLVVRWRSPAQWSRCVWDVPQRQLRIERCSGGQVVVMARGELPDRSTGFDVDADHELAVQVNGFRVQVFVDDTLALQCFDGGSAPGSFGLCHRGRAPTWRSLTTQACASPTISAALVRGRADATLHVAAPLSPGQPYVLEFALDRPHPLVLAPNGVEALLLVRPAAPQVLLDDWRQSVAAGSSGELGRDGAVLVRLPESRLPALSRQVALLRILFVPGGESVVAASRGVPLTF